VRPFLMADSLCDSWLTLEKMTPFAPHSRSVCRDASSPFSSPSCVVQSATEPPLRYIPCVPLLQRRTPMLFFFTPLSSFVQKQTFLFLSFFFHRLLVPYTLERERFLTAAPVIPHISRYLQLPFPLRLVAFPGTQGFLPLHVLSIFLCGFFGLLASVRPLFFPHFARTDSISFLRFVFLDDLRPFP